MEIRALREADDRSAFRSGDPDLDGFFQRYAGQNQFRHHIGTTYVAVEGATILGYATIAPGQIDADAVPVKDRPGLPRYPLPILRLARLAVGESDRSRGVGTALLRFVLELALRLEREYGCLGILVDAKPGAEAFYTRHSFLTLEPLEGEPGTRPRPTTMFLSIRDVQAARGKP